MTDKAEQALHYQTSRNYERDKKNEIRPQCFTKPFYISQASEEFASHKLDIGWYYKEEESDSSNELIYGPFDSKREALDDQEFNNLLDTEDKFPNEEIH